MSNNFDGHGIWHLDTAFSAGELLYYPSGMKVKLLKMIWYPNAVDNDIDVQDANGESIMKCRAKVPSGANREEIGRIIEEFGNGRWFDGFKLITIDGGILDVYLA